MGLRYGARLAEYILGGWCIGTVLDSAASRAALPGQFLSNSDPTSFALNVDVHVEWWTGDKMFRYYCDREGKYLARHEAANADPLAYTKGPETPAVNPQVENNWNLEFRQKRRPTPFT
jgi:hypothetical protein